MKNTLQKSGSKVEIPRKLINNIAHLQEQMQQLDEKITELQQSIKQTARITETALLANSVEQLSATLDANNARINSLEHWRTQDNFLKFEDIPPFLDGIEYKAELQVDIETLYITIELIFQRLEHLELGWWQRFIDELCHRWHSWRGGGADY